MSHRPTYTELQEGLELALVHGTVLQIQPDAIIPTYTQKSHKNPKQPAGSNTANAKHMPRVGCVDGSDDNGQV